MSNDQRKPFIDQAIDQYALMAKLGITVEDDELVRRPQFGGNADDVEVHVDNTSKYTVSWWARSVVHNMVVHPLLPLADLLALAGFKRIAATIHGWHDDSVPSGGG